MGPSEVDALLTSVSSILTTGRRTRACRDSARCGRRSTGAMTFCRRRRPGCCATWPCSPGTFLLDAVLAVVGDSDSAPFFDCFANLFAKSLVVADVRGDTSHYRLLHTTRVYALEKAAKQRRAQGSARRHAEFYRECLRVVGSGDRDEAAAAVAGHL